MKWLHPQVVIDGLITAGMSCQAARRDVSNDATLGDGVSAIVAIAFEVGGLSHWCSLL